MHFLASRKICRRSAGSDRGIARQLRKLQDFAVDGGARIVVATPRAARTAAAQLNFGARIWCVVRADATRENAHIITAYPGDAAVMRILKTASGAVLLGAALAMLDQLGRDGQLRLAELQPAVRHSKRGVAPRSGRTARRRLCAGAAARWPTPTID